MGLQSCADYGRDPKDAAMSSCGCQFDHAVTRVLRKNPAAKSCPHGGWHPIAVGGFAPVWEKTIEFFSSDVIRCLPLYHYASVVPGPRALAVHTAAYRAAPSAARAARLGIAQQMATKSSGSSCTV